MSGVNIGLLVNTNRPLLWGSEPNCPRCLLPFTSSSSHNPVDRVPFLLDCQHMLCGQCVQEFAEKNNIACVNCPRETPFPKDQKNTTRWLHPSLFLLGALLQAQRERACVESYRQEKDEKPTEKQRPKCLPTVPLALDEIDSPEKLLSLLEKGYHSCDKSKKFLENQTTLQQDNVSTVVDQINAHFIAMHNALQVEEDRMLQLVRKKFLERSQQNVDCKMQLRLAKTRLKEYIKRTKRYTADIDKDTSDDRRWKKLILEVKKFIENEPLKAEEDRKQPTFRYQPSEKFLENIQSCHNLCVEEPQDEMCLVPITHGVVRKDCAEKPVNSEALPLAPLAAEKEVPPAKKHSPFAKNESALFTGSVGSSGERKHSLRKLHRFQSHTRFEPAWRTVYVTCVVSPHEFYVQDELFANEGAASLSELCNSEADSYQCELIVGDSPLTIVSGSLYLVSPEGAEELWYRAEVLAVDEPTRGHYKVQYVDIGTLDTITHNQIRPISEELASVTRGVIKCTLYDVQSTQAQHHWAEECHQIMLDFVGSQPMKMCELYKCIDQTLVVDLFLLPVAAENERGCQEALGKQWKGHYAPMSLRAALIYLALAEPSKDSHRPLCAPESIAHKQIRRLQQWVEQVTDMTRRYRNIPGAPILQEHDHFGCTISQAISPYHFYLLPTEWKMNALEPLQRELTDVCQVGSSTRTVYCPYEGLVCAFASTSIEDGTVVWLRGRVQKVLRRSCELFALDSGEVLEVSYSDMRLLQPTDPALAKHALAVSCRLGHIRPKQLETVQWTQEAIDEFRQVACSGTLQFSVSMGRWEKKGNFYNVVLFLINKSDRETCVNGLLVRNGHAHCTGQEEDIRDRIRDMKSEERPTTAPPGGMLRMSDPRLPVEVLNVVSPSEFYVLFCSRKTHLEELHQFIQEQMDDRIDQMDEEEQEARSGPSGWSRGDMCVVFARGTAVAEIDRRGSGGELLEWHRARIGAVLEDGVRYEAFLIDRAVTVEVHRTNVARLATRVAQIQPGAIRCRLACLSPIGGSTIWHQSSLDAFRKVVKSYAQHAISLDEKPTAGSSATDSDHAARALPVVLWGVRNEDREALAPCRTVYSNLNQALAKVGLAHLSGRFRTFATSGSGAAGEHQLLEDAIAEQVRVEYERMEQFFRTVAAVTNRNEGAAAAAAGEGTVRDGSKTAQDVLNKGKLGVWMDASCLTTMALVEAADTQHIAAWPSAVPLEKTIFVGVPTYIGSDGSVFLHDVCQEPLLERIRSVIQKQVASVQRERERTEEGDKTNIVVGRPYLARFHIDGQFYRATVTQALDGDRFGVLFVDYGNLEVCTQADLLPATVCGQVPVQAIQIRLSGIAPKRTTHKNDDEAWPEAALDACHSLIVQKRCSIRVDPDAGTSGYGGGFSPRLMGTVPRCTLRLLDVDGGIDVADALCELKLFIRQKQRVRANYAPVQSRPSRPVRPVLKEIEISELKDKCVPLPNRTPCETTITPEQRDLMRWMEGIQQRCQETCAAANDWEDPNEWNSDDSLDPLNRAQLIDPYTGPEVGAAWDEPATGPRLVTLEVVDPSPQPSPASMHSSEFETSSRLSADCDDHDNNDDGVRVSETVREGHTRSTWFRSFPLLSVFGRFRHGFYAEFCNYGESLTLHIYPHLEEHTVHMIMMAQQVQLHARSSNNLHAWQASVLEPGAPCLAPYHVDGRYYRALIEACDEKRQEVSVLFVDYLNRETVPMAQLRKCPLALRRVSLRNIPVRLAGVYPNSHMRIEDIVLQLVNCLQKTFYVRMVDVPHQAGLIVPTQDKDDGDITNVPLVELYTDHSCKTLVYQRMIDAKYFHKTRSMDAGLAEPKESPCRSREV